MTTAANQDSPEDIQVQARGLKKPKAVWSTETATADDAAPPSINRNSNGKVKANIDGGKYGSTGCASLEHHTESGAVLPTTAIDVENMYTAGEAAVFGWNNPVVESKESAALLYRAVEESANVAPAAADTDMRSTSGKNGEADDEQLQSGRYLTPASSLPVWLLHQQARYRGGWLVYHYF